MTVCSSSRRVDGLHSWRFDGDDPRVICVFCNEMRDALSGCVICHAPHFDDPGTDGTVSLAAPPVPDHHPEFPPVGEGAG